MFLIAVVRLVKMFLSPSLFRLLIQNKHITLVLSPPYIQSNGDLLSAKIEQLSVLIHNANHQICNARYDNRKMMYVWKCVDLSDILYPGNTLGENLCIVCTDLSLLYAPAVTLQYNIYVEDIYWFVLIYATVAAPARFDENRNNDPILCSLVKFIR